MLHIIYILIFFISIRLTIRNVNLAAFIIVRLLNTCIRLTIRKVNKTFTQEELDAIVSIRLTIRNVNLIRGEILKAIRDRIRLTIRNVNDMEEPLGTSDVEY